TKRRKPPAEASAGAVAAVSVERRAGAKGNTHQQSTYWTQSQGRVSKALERIRRLVPLPTRGRSRMRESRTYGSGRGACDETHVPTATKAHVHHAARWRGSGVAVCGACATERAHAADWRTHDLPGGRSGGAGPPPGIRTGAGAIRLDRR